ncbi:hypothetical protein ScPMuIL_014493 [Solemya velum]
MLKTLFLEFGSGGDKTWHSSYAQTGRLIMHHTAGKNLIQMLKKQRKWLQNISVGKESLVGGSSTKEKSSNRCLDNL